jgi:DNA-3-methyladenine glycosylase I
MMKELNRCQWCVGKPLYEAYHDTQWGVPLFDNRELFEFLILEGMQAGLSWWCILQKREHFKKVFLNFDPEKIARFNEKTLENLLTDPGIIRNRLKVYGTVQNAKAFLKLEEQVGDFSTWLWQFTDGVPIQNQWKSLAQMPTETPLSKQLSKALKQAGFTFVGSTICYAFMQAVGMVNDHIHSCFRYQTICNFKRE